MDQLHKEELDEVRDQHQQKVAALRQDFDSLQEETEGLKSALRKEEDIRQTMVEQEDADRRVNDLQVAHDEQLKKLREEHEEQLQQIEKVRSGRLSAAQLLKLIVAAKVNSTSSQCS